MSGITSFTATTADSALDFAWEVDPSLINASTIRKITIVTNDYSNNAITRHNISPVVVSGDVTLTATIEGLTAGLEYGAVILIKVANGTTYSHSLDNEGQQFIKVLSVPLQPVITVSQADKRIKAKINNYTENGSIKQSAIGHTDITQVYLYVSSTFNKTFVVHKFTPGADHFGETLSSFKIITDGDNINGNDVVITNSTEYEIAIQTENAIGLSPMSATHSITPSDLPGLIADTLAIPQVIVDGSNVLQNVVAFGNTDDQDDLARFGKSVNSYTLYRYLADGSGNATGEPTMIHEFTGLDASGLSTSPIYVYNDVSYSFVYADASGLVAGTDYVYSVIGRNENGAGDETFMTAVRAGVLADEPSINVDYDSPTQITVHGEITGSTGGFDLSQNEYSEKYFRITLYDYLSETQIYQDIVHGYTFEELTTGTTYTVTVEAITMYNGVVLYSLVASKNFTPYTDPAAPTDLSYTLVDSFNVPLDGKINLTWSPVTDKGGMSGTVYYSVYVNGGSFTGGSVTDELYALTSYQLTGLTNGTSYTIYVTAYVINTERELPVESAQSSSVTAIPFKLPSNATSLALERISSTQLRLTYDLSNDTGLADSQFRTYISVHNDTNSSDSNINFEKNGITGVSNETLNVTGLTAGHTYTFSVKTGIRNNSITYYNDDSTYQTTTGTAYFKPDAPVITSLNAIEGGFTVAWTQGNMRGTTFDSYEIYVDGEFYDYTSGSPYTVTDLTNGQSYNVEVKTIGTVSNYVLPDTSENITSDSSTSQSITPQGTLSSPTVTKSGTNQTVTLTWTLDPSAVGYEVVIGGITYTRDVASGNGSSFSFSGNTVTFTVSGLTNGDTYNFSVKTYTRPGTDNYYSSATTGSVVPLDVPSAPQNLTITIDSNTINSSWTAPNSSNAPLGSVLYYRYVIDSSYSDGVDPVTTNIIDIDELSELFYDMSNSTIINGKRYVVSVYAYYEANGQLYESAPATDVVIVNTLPEEISGLTVSPSDHQNVLTWTNPLDTDIYTRTEVKIYVSINDGSESLLVDNLSGTATTYTHTGLTNGSTYTYRVVSVPDSWANTVEGVSASAIPFGKPIFVSASPNSSNSAYYNVRFANNGRFLGDWVAIGATSGGSLLVRTGTASNESDPYATVEVIFNTTGPNPTPIPVEAMILSVQNAAGITSVTVPTGTTTVFNP
jgi:hypothetical protein